MDCTFLDLTLYHTILNFNHPKEKGFGKQLKREKMLTFSSFPVFSTLVSKRDNVILATFNLLSLYAFNLVTSKNFLVRKG